MSVLSCGGCLPLVEKITPSDHIVCYGPTITVARDTPVARFGELTPWLISQVEVNVQSFTMVGNENSAKQVDDKVVEIMLETDSSKNATEN